MKLIVKILIVSFISGLISCKKFVDVPPPNTRLVSASVYSSNATASAAVTGIYSTMITGAIGGNRFGISSLLSLYTDELKLYPTTDVVLTNSFKNSLSSDLNITFWNHLYNCIYQANLAITDIANSGGITLAMKNQLIGESKFVRAFCYFYLVNIFGDVPLVLNTDYKANSIIAKSPSPDINEQIITDLKEAQSLLNDAYLNPDGTAASTRVRPNRGAVNALLARVYLYQKKWSDAEAAATAVINNTNYQLLTDLSKVFLATNNKEAIWQLESRNRGFNAPDASGFLGGYNSTSGPSNSNPILLNDTLINSFELGDLRKINWTVSKIVGSITYYFPYKYKLDFTGQPPVEYPVVLRLAEQYLIRAEARAQQGNLDGAKSDLNTIRTRANLANTSVTTQSGILDAIKLERRFELFTEYGHRFFDLKRTGNIDDVMNIVAPQKGASWQTTANLFPIPLTEIQTNPNLTQNPGYN